MTRQVFNIGGRKLRISVVETTRPERVLGQRAALVEAQRTIATEEKLDDVLLFVVDILNEDATFLSSSHSASRLVEHSWGCSVSAEGTCVLPVSAPAVEVGTMLPAVAAMRLWLNAPLAQCAFGPASAAPPSQPALLLSYVPSVDPPSEQGILSRKKQIIPGLEAGHTKQAAAAERAAGGPETVTVNPTGTPTGIRA